MSSAPANGLPPAKKQKTESHKDPVGTPTTTTSRQQHIGPHVPCPPALVPATSSTLNPDLFYTDDQPLNKKGFRYVHCWVNPLIGPNAYSLVEVEPFGARISYEDRSPNMYISEDCTTCSSDEGYRSARANVGINDGDWYFEVEVLAANESDSDSRHVRIGLTRREASLEAPVGHDAYGYGLRDIAGEKVHLSRPKPFMNASFKTGDVIGFHVSIPKEEKDVSKEQNEQKDVSKEPPKNSGISRDRIPIKYKGKLLFEILDYVPIKDMDELILPTNLFKKQQQVYEPPTIKGSFINVYKNGEFVGTAFEDLIDFRFPYSKLPSYVAKASEVSVDNGMLGYYPTISSFRGGKAKFHFGPEFKAAPKDLKISSGPGEAAVKPLSARYVEQIAEDIVYDIVDGVVDGIVNDSVNSLNTEKTEVPEKTEPSEGSEKTQDEQQIEIESKENGSSTEVSGTSSPPAVPSPQK